MCPKPLSGGRRVTLRTRWNRARARIFAFQSDFANRHRDSLSAKEQERFPPGSQWLDYDYRRRDRAKVKKHLAAAQRWLFKGRRDDGLTETLMTRLEYQLDQLWEADDWKTRHRSFRRRLSPESGAVKAFDGLITAGCYADLIVAGVTEIAQTVNLRSRVSPQIRQRARRQTKQLAKRFSDLADDNAAAVQSWPADVFPVFRRDLTPILRDEEHRLNELADALDLRHYTGVRPHRITMFLAAVNHAKDVTGTYRDGKFAQMLDGLGVLSRGYPLSEETILKWRQRGGDAERYDPRRPWVDRLREVWT